MKLLLFLSGLVLLCKSVFSQGNNEFYNNGSVVHIQAGAEVHVLGDVHMRGSNSVLENNGLIKLDGNLYSDNLFQQRGTGTVRLQNNLVNIGQPQKISGSYAVRGLGSANKGVNDGSFYILELANDQGIVWLETSALASNTPYVADVRFGVDFQAGGILNRIITMDPATVITNTTNGPDYTAVFGIMNPNAVDAMAWGQGGMKNNTVTLNGNMSTVDAGYVQGNLRRQIDPAGGNYPFILGLEPNVAGAQRGVQLIKLNFQANMYDVLEGYFYSGLDNNIGPQIECSGYQMDYFGGTDHGQWVINDPVGGAGIYSVTVWPQDDNVFPAADVWMITKDNSIQGTPDECGPSPIGLTRSGFNGFSTFGVVASSSYWLPAELLQIWAESKSDFIQVNWKVATEHNLDYYVLERSMDGSAFDSLTTIQASGNSTVELSYSYDDHAVIRDQNYYYRYRSVDFDGSEEYSPIVQGRLNSPEGLYLELYPNPASDLITLSIGSELNRSVVISLFDNTGRLIATNEMLISKGNNAVPVDVRLLSDGVYTFKIEDLQGGQLLTERFIKN